MNWAELAYDVLYLEEKNHRARHPVKMYVPNANDIKYWPYISNSNCSSDNALTIFMHHTLCDLLSGHASHFLQKAATHAVW